MNRRSVFLIPLAAIGAAAVPVTKAVEVSVKLEFDAHMQQAVVDAIRRAVDGRDVVPRA